MPAVPLRPPPPYTTNTAFCSSSLNVIFSVQIKRKIPHDILPEPREVDVVSLDTFFPTDALFPCNENETVLSDAAYAACKLTSA